MNVKLLKKVRKLIAEEPRRLDMEYWGVRVKDLEEKPENPPPCGTVACLAGWTVLAAHPKKEWNKMFRGERGLMGGLSVADKAAELLGFDDSDELPFHEVHWGTVEVLSWIDEQIAKAEAL